MYNITSTIPYLTPDEFSHIKSEILEAMQSTGEAESVDITMNEVQRIVCVTIKGLRVERAERLTQFLHMLGRESHVESSDGPENIAA